MPSFANKKQLRIEIALGDGTFGNADHIAISGLRTSLSISLAGGVQWGQCRGRINGMRKSDMEAVTSYAPRVGAFKPNIMRAYAIDGAQESLCFVGNIVTAWADYSSMPDVCLDIQAQAGAVDLLKSIPPRSFKGAIDVGTAMQQIAGGMGWAFENHGVAVTLENVYLANTGMRQVQDLAEMAGVTMWAENNTIAIAPKGTARGDIVPLVSAKTGLVGYPTYDGVTVMCKTLYNPAILQGGKVHIDTDVTRAAGDWLVLSIDHELESERPGGQWFSTFRAVDPRLYGKR